jgi:hypothetical protein
MEGCRLRTAFMFLFMFGIHGNRLMLELFSSMIMTGAIFFLVIAAINLVAYFFSSKIVLSPTKIRRGEGLDCIDSPRRRRKTNLDAQVAVVPRRPPMHSRPEGTPGTPWSLPRRESSSCWTIKS